jgi:hypothetical protein
MPTSPQRRAGVLRIRLRIYGVLGVKGACKELDANVMRVARILYPFLTAVEVAVMDDGIVPHWMTSAALHVMLGGGEPPDAARGVAPPTPALVDVAAAEPPRRYVWSRVVDVYLNENREHLRLIAEDPKLWRRTGLKMWKRLKFAERKPYIAKMRARRMRAWNASTGLWTHRGAALEPSDDHLKATDLVLLQPKQSKKVISQNVLKAVQAEVPCGKPCARTWKQLRQAAAARLGFGRTLAKRHLGLKECKSAKEKRKAGRKKGSRVMEDEKLTAALQPFSTTTSMWSARFDKPKRQLTSSKRKVFEACTEVNKTMSYETMCRQTKRCRLGFGKGSKRVDKCDICAVYDSQFAPRVDAIFKEFSAAMNEVDTSFSLIWKDKVARDFKAEGFEAAASPAFLREYKEFIDLHGVSSVNLEIIALSEGMIKHIDSFIKESEGYSSHFAVRDLQHAALAADMSNPAENTLYILYDQQDPGVENVGVENNL